MKKEISLRLKENGDFKFIIDADLLGIYAKVYKKPFFINYELATGEKQLIKIYSPAMIYLLIGDSSNQGFDRQPLIDAYIFGFINGFNDFKNKYSSRYGKGDNNILPTLKKLYYGSIQDRIIGWENYKTAEVVCGNKKTFIDCGYYCGLCYGLDLLEKDYPIDFEYFYNEPPKYIISKDIIKALWELNEKQNYWAKEDFSDWLKRFDLNVKDCDKLEFYNKEAFHTMLTEVCNHSKVKNKYKDFVNPKFHYSKFSQETKYYQRAKFPEITSILS